MALKGVRVIELAGLAPAPFCGMLLADFGARVIRVDRARSQNFDSLSRGKVSIGVNLKNKEGRSIVHRLCNTADVLIEPYRPGVMEKLGLGPQELMKDNPRLIYARMTGYGQEGPLSHRAGHDINYIAISGLLSRLGRAGDRPYAPINLLADFAGGGMTCAFGILLALYERTKSGRGQVIDSNMVEGAAYIGSFVYQLLDSPIFSSERGTGWLDGGAPFYDTYKTKDNKYMAVGAIEAQFYGNLLKGLGIAPENGAQFHDWVDLRRRITDIFASRTQAEWCSVFDDVDACVTPVLSIEEAAKHAHNVHRKTFAPRTPAEEVPIPGPAPRLSETPGSAGPEIYKPSVGEHTVEILKELGYSSEECSRLLKDGVVDCGKRTSNL